MYDKYTKNYVPIKNSIFEGGSANLTDVSTHSINISGKKMMNDLDQIGH